MNEIVSGAGAEGAALTEWDAKALLAEYGIRVPGGIRLSGPDEVDEAALSALKPPFVCKVLNREGAHKSDFGGLRLGLSTVAEVRAAAEAVTQAARKAGLAVDGVLVEEQADRGTELVIGGLVDSRFGPCVMVGLGGIFVEIFQDVAFRVAPITEADARAMLSELKASAILGGARGGKAVDIEPAVAALLAIGGADGLMLSQEGRIAEIDINPLILNDAGAFAADARIILTGAEATPLPAPVPLDEAATVTRYEALFRPRSIAILGASATGTSFGNEVIRHSRAFGYKGKIIPIHPKADEVEGLPACRSLADLPEPVDFAYVAIGAEAAVAALEAAPGKARFVQVMSSGFGEAADGVENERRLKLAAEKGGMRVLGPNCLGVHSPRGGLTFVGNALPGAGPVGIVSQSGGLAVDMILRGQNMGLRFAAVSTLGNSVDLKPADLLEFHLADPETKVIGLYLEDVRDGRRFVQRLVEARARKPVVLLVGGRTDAGRRAAASHTGSLAADSRLWDGVARQTGVILTDTLDGFLNALLGFQMLVDDARAPVQRVALFGNGGGTSVLAADALARGGLSVPNVSPETRARLDALGLPPGTGLDNPIDTPAGTMRHRDGEVVGEILDILVEGGEFDAIVVHVNLTVFATSSNQKVDVIGNIVREAVRIRTTVPEAPRLALVLRSDGSEVTENRKRSDRRTALDAGLAVYDELVDAAAALSALAAWERFRASR
ncbi:acetate--CoA ligase family protein [Oceanibacterium hippocampi]|uniref:Succinyl-CoA ligase [ADP-forming] subunit alpha n=1 Tax=Oceanibacterium hippocampi TaxID=745714 RepID=A0A1Y5SSM0_9PROT|nr:acetate--CoA ligase family protein [Oceanibacterium hippocampi]SLN47615.1 Succinyl-CoA ligase [ADP-forming] subunit alpha [Oceanibacterium hippocampi]